MCLGGHQYGGRGVGPQVNKFEQVSSDDHQISVAGDKKVLGWGGDAGRYPDPVSEGRGYPTL